MRRSATSLPARSSCSLRTATPTSRWAVVQSCCGFTSTRAGVLTDGRLRDFDELARYDFAAYCSGEATRWGGDGVTPFQVNLPVVLDRVGVVPGSYVFADSSGAVVIPARQIEEVLEEARKVEAADAAGREAIAREHLRTAVTDLNPPMPHDRTPS